MCWLAIGFLLIICVLLPGRSGTDVLSLKDEKSNTISYRLHEKEHVMVEGIITTKEYKESIYGGYWQVVLKKVVVRKQNDELLPLKDKIYSKKSHLEDASGKSDRIIAKLEGKYLCQITKNETMNFKLGQRILLEATYASWEKLTNEGQFDSAKYYISQGILGQFKKGQVIKSGVNYDILRENMWQFRQNMQEILQYYLGQRDGGLISAMLLGEKSDLEAEDKNLYQRNGISHILAISGLHLSLLGMGIYNVLLRIMPGKKQAAVLCIIIMSLYCVFTGNSISTIRATIMFALSLLATILGRSYDSLSALGLTAILQLFFNPYVLNNSGFLLSFLAVIGVTFLAPRLQHLFSCKKKWEKSLCISLSATLTTLPVILISYGTYPWYSVFLNLLVLPAMSLLLFCAILLLIVAGLFGIWYGNGSGLYVMQDALVSGSFVMQDTLVNGNMILHMVISVLKTVIKLILHYFELCCETFEKLIYQDGYIGAPGWIAICIYGILLVVVASDKFVKSVFFRKMLLMCALSVLTMRFHYGVEINMLDVGQGDCVVIRNSNGNVYISDCGSSSVSKVGRYRLLPFLKYKGYGKIKGIFISHMDEDHMNGILELMEMAPTEHLQIEYLFLPESVLLIEEDQDDLKELKTLVSKNETKIIYLSQGEEIQDDKLRFSCLYPDFEDSSFVSLDADNMKDVSVESVSEVSQESISDVSSFSKLDRNNSSLVLLMEYQNFEMLFTGDVEKSGEQEIVNYVQELKEQPLVHSEKKRDEEKVLNKKIGLSRKNELVNENERIDVLKVAHHGSSGSSCEEFLEVFQPKISLISCGKNNSYGHPHEETLERLGQCGTKIFSTVDSGEITMKVYKRKVKIKQYKTE